MTAVMRRIRRLEDQFGSVDRPRDRFRILVCSAGAGKSLENATCTRTLWPDGTLFEMVELDGSNEGPGEVTDEALDRWLEGFPIQ